MESLEVSARTVNEAIQQALAILGKSRDEVDISVLSEGSRGILGIGGEEARILVSVRQASETPEIESVGAEGVSASSAASEAQEVLEHLLSEMHVEAQVAVRQSEAKPDDEDVVTLNIDGEDLGILIGRRGDTLASLQFLVNLIVSKKIHHWTKVAVDVGGYRLRRQDTLKGLALRMAERVRLTRQPVTLEAMPANERRIVHVALQGHPYATTQSIGQGEDRKVVIMPRK
ncbi:MAG: protein jag [Chloroflexi bacterium]|nr:protein jag [Chloroflexota bacterium]